MMDSSLFFDLVDDKNYTSLAGKFLIASPYCMFNDMFSKSLIYVASHNKQGAVGLIVNHFVNEMSSKSLIKILKEDASITQDMTIKVCLGGPVDPERGFVLHSVDYKKNILFRLNDELSVSSNVDIIKDMMNGYGPSRSLFVMGYTGWEAGQLEKEMENNYWIVGNSNTNIIFGEHHETKWQLALYSAGIQSNIFSSQVGHG